VNRNGVCPVVSASENPLRRCQQERDQTDRQDGDERGEAAVDAQEDRDREDREQLTDGPDRQEEARERATQQGVLTQDRKDGAQGRRGEGQRHRDVGVHVAHGREATDDRGRSHGGGAPRTYGQPAGPREQGHRVDLEPGEQEHEAEPDVGDQLQLGRALHAQARGTDEDAAEDEQHHLRHRDLGDQGGDDGCKRRDRSHDEQLG
jgi:hypothetical protein